MITVYQCDYCSHTHSFSGEVSKHETKCLAKRKLETCHSCKHKEYHMTFNTDECDKNQPDFYEYLERKKTKCPSYEEYVNHGCKSTSGHSRLEFLKLAGESCEKGNFSE